jgi:hypothetical protein
MSKAIQLYRLFNVLSLDVVAGALVCALFFARIFFVSITPYELIALGLTVWIIYTADHLRDARRIRQQASTARHRFHQLHFDVLVVVMIGLVIMDALTLTFIPTQVLAWGVVLILSVSVYLVTHRSLKFLKELFISLMYSCGILLPSLSMTQVELNASHCILIVQFVVLALANLFVFSWFDRELDQQDRQHSFVTVVGERATRVIIWLLIILEVLLALINVFLGEYKMAPLLLGMMGLMLITIFVFRESLSKNDYYRLLGDAVFVVPVFYLI